MTTTLKSCSAPPFTGDRCRSEPVITLLVGCVHEHLKEVSLCQWDVECFANGGFCCKECLGHDGHVCEMSLLREVTS